MNIHCVQLPTFEWISHVHADVQTEGICCNAELAVQKLRSGSSHVTSQKSVGFNWRTGFFSIRECGCELNWPHPTRSWTGMAGRGNLVNRVQQCPPTFSTAWVMEVIFTFMFPIGIHRDSKSSLQSYKTWTTPTSYELNHKIWNAEKDKTVVSVRERTTIPWSITNYKI